MPLYIDVQSFFNKILIFIDIQTNVLYSGNVERNLLCKGKEKMNNKLETITNLFEKN